MKCYCYETDSAFIFCVEDVENAQLEDVSNTWSGEKSMTNFFYHIHKAHFQTNVKKSLLVAI